MISNARGGHSSPGIYMKEVDVTYSTKSLGITTLGVAGETLKGPAFEPVSISKWSEFYDYFGGTSTEKFADTDYPKYELPYIAKEYLKESQQLEVVRVLGLSGYNAGKAWAITAEGDDGKKYVVAVLRSRGKYVKHTPTENCEERSRYDVLTYYTEDVKLENYTNFNLSYYCDTTSPEFDVKGFSINTLDYGHLTVVAVLTDGTEVKYPVSLNPADKDYIINVLGTNPTDGSAPVFVEALYDVALENMIYDKTVNQISSAVTTYAKPEITPVADEVEDYVSVAESNLTRKLLGHRFIVNESGYTYSNEVNASGITENLDEPESAKVGDVLRVMMRKTNEGTKYQYVKELLDAELGVSGDSYSAVSVASEDSFMYLDEGVLKTVANDVNNYKGSYSCASTPWIVSEAKGDANNVDLKKLFRFHTISDGNAANTQVKISIQNIRPDDGTFDVVIRDFYDTDASQSVLEKFTKCTMVPGTSNYIGLKIGTTDGSYLTNSKYVTVEVVESDETERAIPAGFLGYPLGSFGKDGVEVPAIKYNTTIDDDIKAKRQYFGLSNLAGVDADSFTYKGVDAYKYIKDYSHGFHLDTRLGQATMEETGAETKITVDGVSGWTFDATSYAAVTAEGNAPVFGLEEDMVGTIYEDVNYRKFTVYPYGGFDGWDPYRNSRTNTDEYRKNKYKGSFVHGVGENFSEFVDTNALGLTGTSITTDYYAYLAGYRQFANPEAVDINVFTTPGIDYVNQTLLSEDALDMIESLEDGRGGDAIYIMTTPDKPAGATDSVDDMYTPGEVVSNLESTDIDSSYAATYYPWIKYFDSTNNMYINLPATKDVVRNLAKTDNESYPWFAPAGINRGNVECAKAHFITKIADEDTLYDGYVNAIKTFAQDGVKVWGNKTMYSTDSPLNRINVRRLMIRVKKLVSRACRQLIFDPDDATVKNQFLGLVQPILNDVVDHRGITEYKIEVDDSVEARDRHELPAKIWIKPTPTLEYIDLTFVITPQGVSWD